MRSFLLISYSLKLRDLYDSVKEKVPLPPRVGNPPLRPEHFNGYRKKMIDFVIPLIQKAFREGRDFAVTYAESRGFPVEKISDYRITDRDKNRIMGVFIERIRSAEEVYQLKFKQNIRLRSMNRVKSNPEPGGYQLIEAEFHSSVKRAVNNLILNSGTIAQEQVFS